MKSGHYILYIASFSVLLVFWFFLYGYSDQFIDLKSGLIICRSDCTDFHNLSEFLKREGHFAPQSGDFHTTPFYWLYIFLVATIKSIFGQFWQTAYVTLMALSLCGFIVFASRCNLSQSFRNIFIVPALVLLAGGNLSVVTFGRTLLTDFGFALLAGVFFLLAARAWVKKRQGLIIGIVIFAVFVSFYRPSGLFLLSLGIGVAATILIIKLSHNFLASIIVIFAVCASVWIFSATMSTYAARNLEAVERGSLPLSGVLGQFLEFNYTGDDHLDHNNRKGGILTNAPYKSWYKNDGTFSEILLTFAARIPKVFEIVMPGYSNTHNTYRVFIYGLLYLGVLGFVFFAFTRPINKRQEAMFYLVLIVGYLFIFVALSHVTPRFRLVFDVAFAVAAANFYADLIQRLKHYIGIRWL